jgi:uncharacterized protein YcbK (DUF882 family)
MPRPTGKITPHFDWSEALCPDGCDLTPGLIAEVTETARWAEKIRKALGGQPMRVLSWYRCPTHNARVGGAPRSQHLLGRAIDFVMRAKSPRQIAWLIEQEGLYPGLIRGFGRYPGFVHIDRRDGPVATWTPATRIAHA